MISFYRPRWLNGSLTCHDEYVPQSGQPPLDSQLAFTPAEFCIGESGVWFFSLMWEHGHDSQPVEFLDDSGIVRE